MGVAELRWSVCPGSGRVAHFGNAVAVVAPATPQQRAFADAALGLVEASANAEDNSASALFRELSGLVIDTRTDDVPAFGVIADDGDRYAVLLCGAATLAVADENGRAERLSGSDAATYLDRRIPHEVAELSLTGPDAGSPEPASDLRLGVVLGSGLAAAPRGRPLSGGATLGAAVATTGPALVADPPTDTHLAVPAAPVTPPAAVPAPAAAGGFVAVAIAAQQDDAAPARAQSGPSHVMLTIAGRPALELARDVVLGRQPANSPDVAAGAADPVDLVDPSVSRTHAKITINSEGVWITDLGSANGTRVLMPSAPAWVLLTPHLLTALEPGTRILFGAYEAECDFTPAGSRVPPEALMVVPRDLSEATGPAGGVADYAFIRSLGKGYHGEFFLAVPPSRLGLDAEFVVVKVISGVTNDEAFRRAVRELRAYASVDSPYLLTVYDTGNDAGRFFYSTPYLPRGSLAGATGSLPREEVLRAVSQVARATHALHEAGILHLGIAPSAVLLGEDKAYLSGVGATQSLARTQTLSGLAPVQDVEFLEPQILLGERGTRASDIWSLGATVYRTLAGVSIYGELPAEPLLAIRTALTTKPTLPVALDEPLMEIVRGCLAQRFATAAEVADALDAVLAG